MNPSRICSLLVMIRLLMGPAHCRHGSIINGPAPQVAPNNRRIVRQVPQPNTDDRYIYPADGDDGRQYPAPPGYRRMTEAETQQYYANRGYSNYYRQPQVYYAPRQRGFFGDY